MPLVVKRTIKISAALTLGIAALLAPASGAQARVVEVGATSQTPAVGCPSNCFAVGRLTGYQARNAEREGPMTVGRDGKLVAFSIVLGKPSQQDINFFENLYGGPSQARISVLRRPHKNDRRRRGEPGRRVLTGQSEVFNLEPYFGSEPTFALRRPLTLKRGYTIALTAVTYVPGFAAGLGGNEQWRASRDKDRCDTQRFPNDRVAHQRLGTLMSYGCLYPESRLLYKGYYVPKPRKTN